MRSNNHNEAITHMAMPEREIPVLIDSEPGKHEGFVPSIVWSDKPMTAVRRVPPQLVEKALADPQQRELNELLALLERVNAGDHSPIIESSNHQVTHQRIGKKATDHIEFTVTGKSLRFAITEAFTKGLSKVKFVIWWSTVANKFVPGLYCPDLATAIYASYLSKIGTRGGIGICQRCRASFPRSRKNQRYCSHKCQVAAAMRRYRQEPKKGARPKPKSAGSRNKRIK